MTNHWDPHGYDTHARFVSDLGAPLLDLLAPQPGERILDLGCGDGVLTERLVAAGASVVGVDASPEMVEAARARGLDARLMNGESLRFLSEFDAVFSNAAMHWMKDTAAVVRGVRAALRPGGRFVGEFGGFGNVAAICVAIFAVLARRGVNGSLLNPWTFPTVDEFRAVLEKAGFEPVSVELIPRPTPLPTDMAGWLRTFARPFFSRLPESERAACLAETVDLLKPVLCDREGHWTADYVRLRFRAVLPPG
jgi:trans-aconitate methyltransferase